MSRTKQLLLVLSVFLINPAGCCPENDINLATESEEFFYGNGPYLGQPLPDETAVMFAPFSTELHDDGGPAFSPDGTEVFWRIYGQPCSIIVFSRQNGEGRWSRPQIAPFSGHYMDGVPCFSPDGNRLYFSSPRPASGSGEPAESNIWYVDRTEDGWSAPVMLGEAINSGYNEDLAFVTADGSLYIIRSEAYDGVPEHYYAMRSRLVDGIFQPAEKLGSPVNSSEKLQILVCGAADESYLVLSIGGRDDSVGNDDLYACFRNDDGTYGEPINLGEGVNTTSGDWLASITPDGKYLFYTSFIHGHTDYLAEDITFEEWWEVNTRAGNGRGGDIYWVSAEVIERLRPVSE